MRVYSNSTTKDQGGDSGMQNMCCGKLEHVTQTSKNGSQGCPDSSFSYRKSHMLLNIVAISKTRTHFSQQYRHSGTHWYLPVVNSGCHEIRKKCRRLKYINLHSFLL
jgi:hypothetical protein